MDNSNDSKSIKLVATCKRCGEPIGSAGGSSDPSLKTLCAPCRKVQQIEDEDDEDDEAPPTILHTGCAKKDEGTGSDEGVSRAHGETAFTGSTSPATPVTDPDVPEQYEILEVLTDCQHGKAFIVRDTKLDTKLMLRFVTIGVARLTGGLPIETIAQLLVQQNSPHLATVYDWRTDMSKNFMVLDAPADKNLETIIKTEGFLDLPRAIDIFIQVVEALEELHRVKIVHGHMRPRSVGIVESSSKVDTVKVTNFSIASVSTNNTEQPLKISRNYTCNDIFYMSPEELRGEVPSVAADIYSLGCVMFHSITGKPVYRARTVQEVKEQHLDPTPAKFRRRYEIPPNVELVVLHMMDPDPAKRYKSARAIRRDLERLRDNKEPLLEDRWKSFLSFFGQ